MKRSLLALVVAVVACAPAKQPVAPRIDVRAGTSGDYPPMSSWLPGSMPDGFALAVFGAFASETHREASYVRFHWPELASDLAANKFDVAVDGITVRPERSIAGIHTVPIAHGGAILLVRRGVWRGEISALDRAERTIAVNEGGHLEKVTRATFRAARIRTVPRNALSDVLGLPDVDAVMTNTFEAPRLQERTRERAGDLVAVGPLTRDTTALWVRADREDLATALDDWLVAAEESGALSALRVRFIGASEPTARPLEALLAATSERLALMPFVAAAKASAGLAVDDPEQEARVLASAKGEVQKAAAALGRPPPPDAMIDAFFGAQFDAAKEVQRNASTTTSSPAKFSLEDLRAAIGRITRRMARLLVRLDVVAEAVAVREAREQLEGSGLSPESIARLGAAHARR